MGSLRSHPAQGYPPPDLTGFPMAPVGDETYRAHRADRGPWWFSSYDPVSDHPSGRFDLPVPRGTCYLASSARGAARERMGKHTTTVVHVDDGLRGTVISALAASDWGSVADLEHVDAPLYGVTRELATSGPYEISAAWAAALDAVAGGVRYLLRFGIPDSGYALFGAAGENGARPADPDPVAILDVLAELGYQLLDAPPALPVIPTPERPSRG